MDPKATPAPEPDGIAVGVTFGPTGNWDAVVRATLLAEQLALDAVGFWDHYHSMQPEWALTCGWSAYGYLAAMTTRIRFTPMVICRPNYLLGVLCKESSILQIASGGRFELGIGAGDFEGEFTAWSVPYPEAEIRIGHLAESVSALRQLWTGASVTMAGEHVHITNAACTPVPPVPPRVVIGAGSSRRVIDSAVTYADEINIYSREDVAAYALQAIQAAGRDVALSIFADRPEGQIPADLPGELRHWRKLGASRYFLTLGFEDDLEAGVRALADARQAAG
jgi:alkanesulfonate monooxygenase SsuD/methylene tetrahydromethanopterin reductase-like flavin-dependent oxidoreductase (luciferase family)